MTRHTGNSTLARRVAIGLWFVVAGVAVAIAATIYGHSNPAMPTRAYTPLAATRSTQAPPAMVPAPAPTTVITEPPIVVTPAPAPPPVTVAPHTVVPRVVPVPPPVVVPHTVVPRVVPAPVPRMEPDPAPPVETAPAPAPEPYYANCTAVRAAGKAPIYPGDPGFRSEFDRDHDGVGCEVH